MILDIFAQNAHTLEGKAQVELALLRYRLPRLRRGADAKLVPAARRRRHPLRQRRDQARGRPPAHHAPHQPSSRPTSRSSAARATCSASSASAAGSPRSRSSATPTPASRRCSTASPTPACSSRTACSPRSTRRPAASSLPGGEPVLLTDTVGFVRRLPHGLVEAFKSTLEVATDADYLVHVVDASAADPHGQIDAVREVLREIGADRRARAARVQQGRPGAATRPSGWSTTTPARSPISAVTGEGIDDFLRALGDRLRVAHARSSSWPCRTTAATCSPPIHREGEVVSTTDEPDVMRVAGPAVRCRRPGGWREFVVADRRSVRLSTASIADRPASSRRPYPYDRLDRLQAARRARSTGGAVDLSIGTPIDPPRRRRGRRARRVGRRARVPAEHRHAPSCARRSPAGSTRRFGVAVDAADVGACVGTKEFVGTLPQWLRLRTPDRDTVLYPAIAYPTYEMGAILAGCRPVAGAADDRRSARPRRRSIADRRRAGAGAVGQQPGQPDRRARRPRRGGRVGPRPRRAGVLRRVLRRVHVGRAAAARSSSTASTASSPCTRCRSARTWPASGSASTPATPSSCDYLQEVRKHVGMMVPGPGAGGRRRRPRRRRPRRPSSASATARRLERIGAEVARRAGRASTSPFPPAASTSGSTPATAGSSPSGWLATAARSSARASSTAPGVRGFVRVAVVQPDDRIELMAARLRARRCVTRG